MPPTSDAILHPCGGSWRLPARRPASGARRPYGWRATARRSSSARAARNALDGCRGRDPARRRRGARGDGRRDARGGHGRRSSRAAVDRFGRLDVMICNAGFGIYGAIDQIEPARMQQLLDVNYMGTYLRRARRAAGLPPPGQRPPDHRVVDRRQARRSVHGRLCGDQVRAGRARRMPARRAARHRAST